MPQKKLVSLILPVYNEELGLEIFHNSLILDLQLLSEKYDFELLYVDDGSMDNSKVKLESLNFQGFDYTIISLSKNFGHQSALTCGLDHSNGDAAITMDTDGQHPSHLIGKLIKQWEGGSDIVFAVREDHDSIPFLFCL